jgi:hypothetical protein
MGMYQPFRQDLQTLIMMLVKSGATQTVHSILQASEESLSLCFFAGKILEKLTMRSLIDAQHRHIRKTSNHIHPKCMPNY